MWTKTPFVISVSLVEDTKHADPFAGPQEFKIDRNERALHLTHEALCSRRQGKKTDGDTSYHPPMLLILKESAQT